MGYLLRYRIFHRHMHCRQQKMICSDIQHPITTRSFLKSDELTGENHFHKRDLSPWLPASQSDAEAD